MPLSDFSDTFDLTELSKGYFPYFHNTLQYQTYVGEMPPKDSYGMKSMKPENKEKFEKWYDEQKSNGFVFNMQQALFRLLSFGCADFT